MKTTGDKIHVPALERGLRVVELLAEEQADMPLGAISKRLGIPLPSLWRIMLVLKDKGYVIFDRQLRTYRLGFKFLYLGNLLSKGMAIRTQARNYLKLLVEKSGETAELAARIKDQLVLLEQMEGPDPVRLFSRVGSAYPYFHATAPGKVYLAQLDGPKLTDVMTRMGLPRITRRTIGSLEALERDLGLVRSRGYAFDREELREGVCRIAAPVYDRSGKVAACLGIAAPSFRLDKGDIERIGPIVKETADALSADIRAGKVETFWL